MNIAIDFSLKPLHGRYNWLNNWLQVAARNTAHQFYFLGEEKLIDTGEENIKLIILSPTSFSFLGKETGFKKKLKQQLKLLEIDVWITNDLLHILKNNYQQWLCVEDLSFIQHPNFFNKNWEIKNLRKALLLSDKKIVSTTFQQKKIVSITGEENMQIDIAEFAVSSFALPLSWPQQESVKTKYSGGKDFFLYTSTFYTSDEILQVLKSFSVFKKWQQSGMQLVFCLHDDVKKEIELFEKIETYKYKQEVHFAFPKTEKEMMELYGAAYSFINISSVDNSLPLVLNAAALQVPVISKHQLQLIEIFDTAVMFTEADNDFEELAKKMILMYKDDRKRNELIQNAAVVCSQFTINKATDQWSGLLNFPEASNA